MFSANSTIAVTLKSSAGAVCGIVSAAALGAISALCAIAFFEGAHAVHNYFNLIAGESAGESITQNLWSLALLPLLAGILCGLLRKYMNSHFLGLSDTMWVAASGVRQQLRAALLSIAASFIAFSGGASVGQYGPVGHLGGFVGEWFRGRWWCRWLAPDSINSSADDKTQSSVVNSSDNLLNDSLSKNATTNASNFSAEIENESRTVNVTADDLLNDSLSKNTTTNSIKNATTNALADSSSQDSYHGSYYESTAENLNDSQNSQNSIQDSAVGWARGVGAACGVAAAIAAAFNAPVTGLLFAHEVILRHYSVRAFAPVAVSAVVGYMVSVTVFERPPFLSIGEMRAIMPTDAILFGVQGALFGVLSALYLRAIFALLRRLSPLPVLPLLSATGGVCGLLWLLSPQAAGGHDLLLAAVSGGISDWQTALTIGGIKILATVLCLGAGFAGGVVSPTLVVGAMAGLVYATIAAAIGVYDGPTFVPVICGMMAFAAPALGAPLASILFVLELSGGNYPLTLAAALAVALSVSAAGKVGNGSYYEQQLKARGIDILRAAEREMQNITLATLLKSIPSRPIVQATENESAAAMLTAKLPVFVSDSNGICLGEMDRLRVSAQLLQNQNQMHNQNQSGTNVKSVTESAAESTTESTSKSKTESTTNLCAADFLLSTPILRANNTLAEVMEIYTARRDNESGLFAITDADGRLLAVVGEGDLWRELLARRTKYENSVNA